MIKIAPHARCAVTRRAIFFPIPPLFINFPESGKNVGHDQSAGKRGLGENLRRCLGHRRSRSLGPLNR